MTNPEKFRSGSALITGWILIAFCISYIVEISFYGSINEIFFTTIIGGCICFGIYLGFLKPYVLIFDEGIKIVNPTKEITASWDRIDEIETKYSMSILIDGLTFHAWAAPAPGRSHTRRMHKSDLSRGGIIPRRLGDSPSSDSGVCAHIARLRRDEFLLKESSARNIFKVQRKFFTQ